MSSSARQRQCGAKKKQATGPPKSGAFKQQRNMEPTTFRLFYKRGDIPVAYGSDSKGGKLMWRKEMEALDFHHYLPLFFDGLREVDQPYAAIANIGVHDMLIHGGGHRIFPVVPQLIIPLKKGLDTKIPQVMCRVMKAMQILVLAGGPKAPIGEALVPYYRQLLPVLNQFKMFNANTGDRIDYSQHKRENIGDLVEETLQLFEINGGEDAFINIKYMVPTYESCVMN